jgi:ubiquinone/menaquinone biosynthesis C-methylase UbiE
MKFLMNVAGSLQINKSRLLQKLFVYNPVRVYLQRRIEAPEVFTGLSLPAGSHCIEIGCGHGAGALLISGYFNCNRIVGIDNDPEIINRARKYITTLPGWARGIRTDHIEFACQDAASLPYREGSFNAAFLFGVLNSVDDWKAIVSGIYRVLKPGGIFSFYDAIRPSTFFYMSRIFFYVPILDEDELKAHLNAVGFTIERFKVQRRQPGCFVQVRK